MRGHSQVDLQGRNRRRKQLQGHQQVSPDKTRVSLVTKITIALGQGARLTAPARGGSIMTGQHLAEPQSARP